MNNEVFALPLPARVDERALQSKVRETGRGKENNLSFAGKAIVAPPTPLGLAEPPASQGKG